MTKIAFSILAAATMTVACATAQEAPAAPQMSIGNGEANAIIVDGLSLVEGETTFSEVRVDGDAVKSSAVHRQRFPFQK